MMNRYAVLAGHPADARRIVRTALTDAPSEVVETVELLTSELVTNAIVHGSSEPTLVVEVGDDRIRVEVHDSHPRMNLEPLTVDSSSDHGRGLAIVDALSTAWGVEPRSSGKAVWFLVDFAASE